MPSEPYAANDLADDPPVTGLARSRSETIQRLQVGLSGLAGMILLVSLANIILDQAREADQGAVVDGQASAGEDAGAPATDPLAEAGVVPDMPAASPSADDAQATQP